MKNNLKKWIILICIGSIVLVGAYYYFKGDKKNKVGKLDDFAKCLTEKEIVMYGADWCPHCKNEKKGFGSSFQYVTYVECPDNPKLCVEKGVKGYPTWIFQDGKILSGEQGIGKLSKESGCSVPQ